MSKIGTVVYHERRTFPGGHGEARIVECTDGTFITELFRSDWAQPIFHEMQSFTAARAWILQMTAPGESQIPN